VPNVAATKQRENSPPASKGRPKGSPNKTTAVLKDAIIKAAEAIGEDMQGKGKLVGYCKFLAKTEPKAFAGLLGKVLPMQIAGSDGGPLQVVIRRFADE
jgi:hypothetical protein